MCSPHANPKILTGCVLKILTGKPTGKRPVGRPRRRWEDNIRMDLEEMRLRLEEEPLHRQL